MSSDSDSDASSGTSGGSFGDWADADTDSPCQSLLGLHTLPTSQAVWEELASATGFALASESAARGWGTYSLVRLVNYLRRAGQAAQQQGGSWVAALQAALAAPLLSADAALWSDESLLAPALEDDALLMDVVSHGEIEEGEGAAAASAAAASAAAPAPAAAALASGSQLPEGALSAAEAAALRAELARSKELLGLMASGAYDSGSPSDDPHAGTGHSDNLTYYFDSYASSTGIHRTMLSDKPRTLAYQAAIQGTQPTLAGKRVLDLGCGTGILSLFAADAGAAAVVALDASSVVQDAAAIVRLNGKAGAIACVMGRCEEAALHLVLTAQESAARGGSGGVGGAAAAAAAGSSASSAEPAVATPLVGPGCTILCGDLAGAATSAASSSSSSSSSPSSPSSSSTAVFDVIVSEWMGYALLYESMLASVLIARDRYLKPGGTLLPSSATLCLGAVSDAALWRDKVAWWGSVYGYDMAPMGRHAWPQPLVEDLEAASLTSAPPHATLARLCMASMRQEDQDIRGVGFRLSIGQGERAEVVEGGVRVHALAVWFHVDFAGELYQPTQPQASSSSSSSSGGVEQEEEEAPELEEVPSSASASAGASASSAEPAPGVVRLCTSPSAQPTHWHHTILLLKTPPTVAPGQTLAGKYSMVRDSKNPREYRFTVELEGGYTQKWHLC